MPDVSYISRHMPTVRCLVILDPTIYNRTPTHTLKWRTPFEIWYSGKVPDVSHLRVFGCKGYMHVPADKRCVMNQNGTL